MIHFGCREARLSERKEKEAGARVGIFIFVMPRSTSWLLIVSLFPLSPTNKLATGYSAIDSEKKRETTIKNLFCYAPSPRHWKAVKFDVLKAIVRKFSFNFSFQSLSFYLKRPFDWLLNYPCDWYEAEQKRGNKSQSEWKPPQGESINYGICLYDRKLTLETLWIPSDWKVLSTGSFAA